MEDRNNFERFLSIFHKHFPNAVNDDSIKNGKYDFRLAYSAENHYFFFFEDFEDVDDCYVSVKELTTGKQFQKFESVSEFKNFLFKNFPRK